MDADGDESREALNLPVKDARKILLELESSDSPEAETERKENHQNNDGDTPLHSLPSLDNIDEGVVKSLNVMMKRGLGDFYSLPGGGIGNLSALRQNVNVDEENKEKEDKVGSLKDESKADGSDPLASALPKKKKQKVAKDYTKGRMTWEQRTACVFAYLHERIGHKDYHLAAEMANVSANTLRGWMTKISLMSKWVPFLDEMTADQAAKILNLDLEHLGVHPHEKINTDRFHEILSSRNMAPVKIEGNQKRVQSNPRCSKWHPQFLFGKKLLLSAWENNLPITIKNIKDALHKEFTGPARQNEPEPDRKVTRAFIERYLNSDGKNHPTLINTLIARIIKRSGFQLKDKTLEESVPSGWKVKCSDLSSEFHEMFKEVRADCVVVTDGCFFGEGYDPTDENSSIGGYLVAVSAVIPSSELLKPFIILQDNSRSGVDVLPDISPSLRDHKIARTVTSKTGRVSTSIMKQVMRHILEQLPGKTVLWVLDEKPSNLGDNFRHSLQEVSADESLPGSLHCFHISRRLSSIMNPIEGFIHRVLRPLAKVSSMAMDAGISMHPEHLPGLPALRTPQADDFVSSVEQVWEGFNSRESDIVYVKEAFSKCGLNPFEENVNEQFKKRLEQIDISEPRKRQGRPMNGSQLSDSDIILRLP